MSKEIAQKQENKSLEDKDSDDNMNVVAGLLRSLGRTAARALPKAGLGSFPMHGRQVLSAVAKKKLSVRTIGKYSQQLSNLAEYFEHWKNSHHDSHYSHGSLTRLALRMKLMLPQILKGSILGTIVFETYDKFMSTTNNNAVLSGAIAGLTHGVCYQIWGGFELLAQRGLTKFRNPSLSPNTAPTNFLTFNHASSFLRGPFTGTLIAHTIAHSSLFSVFQLSKHFFMNVLPSVEWLNPIEQKKVMPSQIIGILYIAFAGALAGGISESLSYYAEPIDRNSQSWVSWKDHLRQIRNLQWPKFKQIVRPALLPSALGFLAYEYGKFESDSSEKE